MSGGIFFGHPVLHLTFGHLNYYCNWFCSTLYCDKCQLDYDIHFLVEIVLILARKQLVLLYNVMKRDWKRGEIKVKVVLNNFVLFWPEILPNSAHFPREWVNSARDYFYANSVCAAAIRNSSMRDINSGSISMVQWYTDIFHPMTILYHGVKFDLCSWKLDHRL